MDGVGQSLLNRFGDSLLQWLGDLAVAGSVALGARIASVVEGVGDVVLNSLGELLLGLVGDYFRRWLTRMSFFLQGRPKGKEQGSCKCRQNERRRDFLPTEPPTAWD